MGEGKEQQIRKQVSIILMVTTMLNVKLRQSDVACLVSGLDWEIRGGISE